MYKYIKMCKPGGWMLKSRNYFDFSYFSPQNVQTHLQFKPKTLRSSLRDINTVKYDRDLTSIYNERKSI